MGHYKSNLRDIEFNLFELLERDRVFGAAPYTDLDLDTAKFILHEVDRLAREDLAESFEEGDRNPPTYDAVNKSVTVTPAFAATYKTWMDAEWWRLRVLPELGGTNAPSSLNWALAEFVQGANPALWTYVGVPTAARVVWKHGTERDRKIAQFAIDNRWGATMVLTEPDAGSDVGAGAPGPSPMRTAPGTSKASNGSSPPLNMTWRTTSCIWCWPARSVSTAPAGRAPRGSAFSWCRSITSTWRPGN